MPKRLVYDRVLFGLTLLLVTFGVVMVFSASAITAAAREQSPYGFLLRQGVCALIGVGALLLVMRFDYRHFKHPAVVYTLLCLAITLLILPYFLDRTANTHRWIHYSVISVQPSEIAKPVLILFVAYFLESRMGRVNEKSTLAPILITLGVFAALVYKEPDLGTTVALVLVCGAMLFVAGLSWRHIGMAALASLPLLVMATVYVGYRRERLLAFLHPWREAHGPAFQIVQSLLAVGEGGITGMGLMNGRQKLFFLPAPHTDFIFAVVGEEQGLIGTILLVSGFALFLVRGLRIARRAPDSFGRLLAAGVTAMVVIQALINFSVVTGLVPTKGIPLPFISYGGSSLVITLAAVGVLLNVSQHAG